MFLWYFCVVFILNIDVTEAGKSVDCQRAEFFWFNKESERQSRFNTKECSAPPPAIYAVLNHSDIEAKPLWLHVFPAVIGSRFQISKNSGPVIIYILFSPGVSNAQKKSIIKIEYS